MMPQTNFNFFKFSLIIRRCLKILRQYISKVKSKVIKEFIISKKKIHC